MSDSPSANDELGFDPEALRAKYRAERDKRLRDEGTRQFIAPAGDFRHFADDPYAEPGFTRTPLSDEVNILIIGGGFAGLSAGAALRKRGITGIRIVEKGGDFGGTWYWNRYPGIQCDIEAYIYLPLLEETGYMPSERYARGPEIWEHARRIARHFVLYDDALFQTAVTELTWLEDERKWLVRTDRGDAFKARHVIRTNGILDRPKLPGIPGITAFKGHIFHTSRWDYAYTGGDSTGGLTGLADKRVAIIGTGATAIQAVPHLARHAKHLYVIQRTPSGIDARGNRPTDPDWWKTLEPGWQRRRRDNFVALTTGMPQDEDMVADGWTDTMRALGDFERAAGMSPSELQAQRELADFAKMNQIRRRIEDLVEDPATAEALKPWYRQFCKRPCFNDDYLPAFNRDNVDLIDTDGKGLEAFTEDGFLFGGKVHPVDCVIFATGFDFGNAYGSGAQQKGHPIFGRGGASLADEWGAGMRTLHGFYSAGFPNLFHMGGSQNGLAFNLTYCLDEQAEHIADVLALARDRDATLVEPTAEAEAEWVATIRAKDKSFQNFQRECTPGNFNDEGKVGSAISRSDEYYGGGPIAFYALIREWRAAGLKGLTIT
ncbi:NAD(P)/FAD-dependent oxidoreductase [Sphingomonas sp. HITSZ_GF]|uniref:flavin-containing monooxygenase n=1 Tax=Sphingomonas sp. HITSZ_GF TaxID=3037247 RepID=UPI00240DB3F8|nr:NAD(P)/FAD-dependent oxidoreductase [Sphingomonas sp. HITSZ_GF]MDG2533890.1 NAD(P)/FAD-dependent oxidoreductase [Sphingomonas sp. HITSZ_GF]